MLDKFFIHVPLDLLYSVPPCFLQSALKVLLYSVQPSLPEHLSSSPPVVPLVLLEISSAVPLKHIPFPNCSASLIFLERFLRVLPLFLTVSPECFSDTPRVFLPIPPENVHGSPTVFLPVPPQCFLIFLKCSSQFPRVLPWFSYSVPPSSPRVFFLFSSSVPHSSPQCQSALLVLVEHFSQFGQKALLVILTCSPQLLRSQNSPPVSPGCSSGSPILSLPHFLKCSYGSPRVIPCFSQSAPLVPLELYHGSPRVFPWSPRAVPWFPYSVSLFS